MANQTTNDSDARTLPAAALLQAASQLVGRALAQLDTRWNTCGGCGTRRYENRAHGMVFERLNALPHKLRETAAKVAAEPPAPEMTRDDLLRLAIADAQSLGMDGVEETLVDMAESIDLGSIGGRLAHVPATAERLAATVRRLLDGDHAGR